MALSRTILAVQMVDIVRGGVSKWRLRCFCSESSLPHLIAADISRRQ